MQAPETLLDRATLERLERLALRWRKSFQGVLGGNNVSRYAGVGHEFLDHRHFQQGDDLRAVNWRVYFRLERLFLKMFRTEPRTPVRILLDTSESMACGASAGAGEAKFSYACRLVAALCYIGLVRLETIVVFPFSSELGESFRAQGGRHRFARAAAFLSGLSTGGSANFSGVARRFSGEVVTSGMVVILSDFLDEEATAAVEGLADIGHELQLIHLAGPEDCEPPWEGELELIDAESGERIRVEMDGESAREYASNYQSFCRKIEYSAARNGGRYLHLRTDVSIEEALYGSLMKAGSVSLQ